MKAFVVFAVALLSVASGSQHGKPDYYWKDFNGKIPEDALKVAQNGSDVPVYIGQGYLEGVGLLPGMLNDGDTEMMVAANGRVHAIKHYLQILATDSKNPRTDFPWVSISNKNFDSLRNLHFLSLPIGGTESHTDVFIGRHSEPGYTNIGKIFTVDQREGLYVPDSEGNSFIYNNFEVLTMLNFECDDDDQENENNSEESNENFSRTIKKKSRFTVPVVPSSILASTKMLKRV